MTDSVSTTDDREPDEGPRVNADAQDDDVIESPEAEVDAPSDGETDSMDEEALASEIDALGGEEPPVESADEADAGEVETPEGASGDESDIGALRAEYDLLNDRHLRLAAEFNNFRRRTESERLEAWSRAQADLVEGFLDVLDDLHRVAELDLSNATVEAIMEGIDLVERKFLREISEAGVEMIDPVGEAFDPERMEAMMRVPTEDESQDDMVAAVFQKGYSLKGILVRPARVSVHKHG